ncbi:hypothetical protein PCK1_002285 [Pneumocystis canis]|nr:hypothetical protein PCK1_002285 [Pneumocystis canis]
MNYILISFRKNFLTYQTISIRRFSPIISRLFLIRIICISRKQDDNDIEAHRNNLVKEGIELYPRIHQNEKYLEIRQAINNYKNFLKNGERILNIGEVTIRGRIMSIRVSSSKLFFYDIYASGEKIQAVCSLREYKGHSNTFLKINRNLHKGDIVEMVGILGKTKVGEFSIFITSKIQLLAPCLYSLPSKILNVEKRFKNRHVDFLIHPETSNYIILRSKILTYIRTFLLNKNFLEVETPILSGTTGGANARPFYTYANSLDGKKIFLRIAPELWLKRLIIGGFDKIFEIGKCFRNEGLDSNHNSEFTICEFYQAYASLEDLIEITKTLLSGLTKELSNNNCLKNNIFSLASNGFFNNYKIIEFIPSLEKQLGMSLPHLDSPLAIHELLYIANQKNIILLKPHTVNRILDQFFDQLLIHQCNEPTFVIHYPEVMSPLAKSSEKYGQKIAHRAELYIFGKEICNFYEEENCPVQQHLKMLQQQKDYNHYENFDLQPIDLDYINALKWGLPPTGGWGMGIDRLCMILSGISKINEVLSFGNIRMTSNSSLK